MLRQTQRLNKRLKNRRWLLSDGNSIVLIGTGGAGAPVEGQVWRADSGLSMIPGHIVVARMTEPTMLDEILKATAVVTDIGGAMCHAALACMEAGIPYIVGTREATTHLAHGDWVRVDPSTKTVTKLEV